MEQAKAISAKCWKIFKDFYGKEKTNESWEEFITAGARLVSQYEGAEKQFASEMYIAFAKYIEEKQKG